MFEQCHRLLGDCVVIALASSGLTVERLEPPCSTAVLLKASHHPLIVIDSAVLDADGGCDLLDEVHELGVNVLVVATDSKHSSGGGPHGADEVVAATDNFGTLVAAVHRLLRVDGFDRDPHCGRSVDCDWPEPRQLLASLSAREETVLDSMMRGLSAVEIAEAQFVAVTTVRSQIRSILTKLNVRSQLAAVVIAYDVGWSADGRQIHQI
jgi:two-component system, NarL family, nitrate/nitrite response regulator NarL